MRVRCGLAVAEGLRSRVCQAHVVDPSLSRDYNGDECPHTSGWPGPSEMASGAEAGSGGGLVVNNVENVLQSVLRQRKMKERSLARELVSQKRP